MSKQDQAKVARRYRAGLAKRLDRIEADVAALPDAVAVRLADALAAAGGGGGDGPGDGGKRRAGVESRTCG